MKKQAKAKVTSVILRVEVETVHGPDLEEVLALRDDDWYTRYVVPLEVMVKKAFKKTPWYVDAMDYYGGIFFDINAVPRSKIPEVMRQANAVIRRWDNKYRISKMKPLTPIK